MLKDWDAERVEDHAPADAKSLLVAKWAEQTQPADAIRWQYDK